MNSSSLATISNQEFEAQNLVKRGEFEQAISIYQNLKPETARTFHHLASLFNEKKGDYPAAIHYYQQALRIEEEVCNQLSNENRHGKQLPFS